MIVVALGLVVVEVCERNAIASLPLEDLEAEYPEIAVLRTNCLTMCHLCGALPYAMVNSKRVFAKTEVQCLSLMKKAVEEEIKVWQC
ncbi:DUF1450 domain-containing protein [Paenibacillus eucommiae]|uniref:Uncharacterized protein YuzB (UPF0349 family) n=1 Tax=Paenibacillus eucommiae TaxID=1355755 RepID=A0ABS4ILL1_9BACL|nr:DUF1450 domain-containing protein [Paenibacillus eucommiae]MBP1988462.1 uncharacterized protein YuzB (UPF0349 family) [Paenibacillus eucommiae]